MSTRGACNLRQSLWLVCLGAGLWWCLSDAGSTADDAVPPDAAEPAGLTDFEDRAFDPFVTLDLIEQAAASGDVELLTDVALHTAHGEAVLLRPRRGVNADELLRTAIQAAAEAGDKEALARLERGITREGLVDLQPLVAAARQLADAPRKLEMPPGLDPSDTTAESMVLYNALLKELRKAQSFGMMQDVQDIIESLPQLPLHKKQRDHLVKLSDQAVVAINAKRSESNSIAQLASASRSLTRTNGVRLFVGPLELKRGAKANYSVVLVKPATMPTKVRVWATGASLTSLLKVPATITIPAGKVEGSVTITAPTNSSIPGVELNAEVFGGGNRATCRIKFTR